LRRQAKSFATLLAVLIAVVAAASGCTQSGSAQSSSAQSGSAQGSATSPSATGSPSTAPPPSTTPSPSGSPTAPAAGRIPAQFRNPLPGMPPVQHDDIYAAAGAGMLSPTVAHDPAYVYVPDSSGDTTTVIDQRTRHIVRVLHSGGMSQHVTPSYDLTRLYVDASTANHLSVIDPKTAKIIGHYPVPRPYNLYFTPDGKQAIVMVEQHNEILFANPHTFQPEDHLQVPGCLGPNHADFSANGRFFVVTCEFSGRLLKISTLGHQVLATIDFGPTSMPQDVRLSPDGTTFYVADMGLDVLHLVNWRSFRVVKTIKMPNDPHGLYPSRDSKLLYVSDRGAGEVSVVSFATQRIVDTWRIPGGGSPDMGGVSADGKTLWLSGRYDGVVYAFNTATGHLIAKIQVGGSPHGMAVWPQPGRYSLGHTGNMR
jgi:DNA-binding beta-propeller fold protein YncE